MIINHPTKKYKAFNKQVMQLVKEEKITLDEETPKNLINRLSRSIENVLAKEPPKISA